MRAASRTGRSARRAAIATACATVVLAVVGISATAANADPLTCAAPSGSTQLTSLSSGLLDCVATSATPAPTTSAVATTAPTVDAPTTPVVEPTPAADTTPTPAAGTLDSVRLITDTATVYPSAKGYSKSRVTFSIRGLSAARSGVGITGSAVLRRGAAVVKSWAIDDTTTRLTWDGKEGAKVHPGLYTLTVTAWSSDGSRAVSAMRVRVSAKHLVTRTVSIRTRDLAEARTDTLPVAVVRGFTYGTVTLRVHTRAKVTGKASLVISGPYDERFTVPLRNGTHVTASNVLPRDFTSATFHHRWAKGAAKLLDLYTVFTYKQLV